MGAVGQNASLLAILFYSTHEGWHWKCQPSEKIEDF